VEIIQCHEEAFCFCLPTVALLTVLTTAY